MVVFSKDAAASAPARDTVLDRGVRPGGARPCLRILSKRAQISAGYVRSKRHLTGPAYSLRSAIASASPSVSVHGLSNGRRTPLVVAASEIRRRDDVTLYVNVPRRRTASFRSPPRTADSPLPFKCRTAVAVRPGALGDVVTLSWIPCCSPEPRVVSDARLGALTAETSRYPPGGRDGRGRADRHERETGATALLRRQAPPEHERHTGRKHGSGGDDESQLRQTQSDGAHA